MSNPRHSGQTRMWTRVMTKKQMSKIRSARAGLHGACPPGNRTVRACTPAGPTYPGTCQIKCVPSKEK